MSCKNKWELDFLTQATLKSFVNGEYRDHRKDLLFDHERSRLPATMPAVVDHLKLRDLEDRKKEILREKASAQNVLAEIVQRENANRGAINSIRWGEQKEAVDKRAFMQKCAAGECRGFLSTAWKCEVCKSYTCSTCFEVKGQSRDAAHICDPQNVESASLIKKETRNCPSCAVPISKISGCDQMWCTQCHVAFSWRTGRRVNGVVHNPHFYAWQKEDGTAPRPPGAVVCGGLPDRWAFQRSLREALTYSTKLGHADPCNAGTRALRLHNAASHFHVWEVNELRRECNRQSDNQDLRIRFILKEMSEKDLKGALMRRDRKRARTNALLQVYELVNIVLTEGVNDISAAARAAEAGWKRSDKDDPAVVKAIARNEKKSHRVRRYANLELMKQSLLYGGMLREIDRKFYSHTRSVTRKCLKEEIQRKEHDAAEGSVTTTQAETTREPCPAGTRDFRFNSVCVGHDAHRRGEAGDAGD